jgi:hypothetical protein
MEENRIWHSPEVIVYGKAITPGTRCSIEAYDLANRKWYQLNVNSEVDDDDLMSAIIEKYISIYYETHGKMPWFNVINNTREDDCTTFDLKPEDAVARIITEKLHYNAQGKNAIATIFSNELEDKLYLGRGVDRFSWSKRDCVSKRIEFDIDIEQMDREIKARETLIAAINLNDSSRNHLIEQTFNVIPILAVVLIRDTDDEVAGILMPFAGPSLESMFGNSSNLQIGKAITTKRLVDLTRGIGELARVGLLHGDINDRNTIYRISM